MSFDKYKLPITIPSGGSITTSGAYGLTFTVTGLTDITLPTTGIVATTANISTHADLITGVHGLVITTAKTLTLTNSLTFAGTDGTTVDARKIDINAQTGTTYTNVLTDAGKLITCSNAGTIAFTLATNASVAHPIGQAFAVQMIGAGVVTITGDTGVTINGVSAGASVMIQYQTIYLVKTATDTWLATGGDFA